MYKEASVSMNGHFHAHPIAFRLVNL